MYSFKKNYGEIMVSNLEIFGKQIPLYGIFFYIGVLAAAVVAVFICKRRSLPKYEIVYSAIFTMIGAVIGAKLLFLIVSLKEIIEEQIPLMAVIKGGFVFYGGLLGGVIGLFIYVKMFKMSLSSFLDVYATVVPVGHAFGRIGCFFAGCCYGIHYDGPGACVYTETVGQTPLNTPLLPVQLIEAACLFVLFAVLLIVYFKAKNRGIIGGIYLMAYAVIRFVLEFFRGDAERGSFLFLSTSQWISVAMLTAGALILFFVHKHKKAKA